jgi:hypothetical protein
MNTFTCILYIFISIYLTSVVVIFYALLRELRKLKDSVKASTIAIEKIKNNINRLSTLYALLAKSLLTLDDH